ncbi:MAG: hypothetical protein DRG78_16855 [Epsilonproteobacteria bacterium]|nr:MAG: hypothetical protein DRG78_16855 [Campylobacterota bacterium]
MAYAGISIKVLDNGTKNIYVRFKHIGKTYPIKNFTKLYGCKTEKQAYDKLQEIKVLISSGKNPFIRTFETLNEIWGERLEQKVKNGDWTHTTPKNYSYFYNKYIKKGIGKKKIEKISYDDLKNLQDSMTNMKNSSKNTLKQILRPIFVEKIRSGVIQKNYIDELKTYNMPIREHLELRVDEKALDIVIKLYNEIPNYKASKGATTEVQAFLYLMLLSGHRFGELTKLKKEDCYIDKKMIISPKSITKTKEDYKFPIPKECIEHIESIEEGLLFKNISKGSVYSMFQRVVKNTNIDLYNNKKISPHDIRKLQLTIMIRDIGIDSILADTCLSHKQQSTIKHYLAFEYSDIQKAYKKYWKLIRKKSKKDKYTI